MALSPPISGSRDLYTQNDGETLFACFYYSLTAIGENN